MATTPHTHTQDKANSYNTLLQQAGNTRLAWPPAKNGEETGHQA